ncbi:MAG: hypothetical protein AAGD05_06000, partial [Bacteroidota bacterium]
ATAPNLMEDFSKGLYPPASKPRKSWALKGVDDKKAVKSKQTKVGRSFILGIIEQEASGSKFVT